MKIWLRRLTLSTILFAGSLGIASAQIAQLAYFDFESDQHLAIAAGWTYDGSVVAIANPYKNGSNTSEMVANWNRPILPPSTLIDLTNYMEDFTFTLSFDPLDNVLMQHGVLIGFGHEDSIPFIDNIQLVATAIPGPSSFALLIILSIEAQLFAWRRRRSVSHSPNGTYTLIDGTSTDFSTLGLQNWGLDNAYDLGGGKFAYFKQGSLQVEVIPEPSTFTLLITLGVGGFFLVWRRRGFSHEATKITKDLSKEITRSV